jgi:hypothetical protein
LDLMKFTGVCVCGHAWDDHHHSCVLNPDCLKERGELHRMHNGCIGDECEATQHEGVHHTKPECHCQCYRDKGWLHPSQP